MPDFSKATRIEVTRHDVLVVRENGLPEIFPMENDVYCAVGYAARFHAVPVDEISNPTFH